jgi:MFS transporter, PPP family, 3-phenylpropionic acid transporter
MTRENRYPWRFAWFMMTYYSANGIYQGYISKYYKQAGISGIAFIALMASMPVVALVMQPLWGKAGDRMRSRNTALRMMVTVSAVLAACYALTGDFGILLLLGCIFAAFYTAIQPMGDSIILEALYREKQPFGPIRISGCVSFALVNLAAGWLLEKRLVILPQVVALSLLVLLASTFALPATAGHQYGKRKVPLRSILKLPRMVPLLILLMMLQLAMGYFYSYFSVYFTDYVKGGTSTLLGLCFFLSAMSELPFLLFSDKLFDRLGTGKLMLFSALVLTLRFFILALTQSMPLVIASQLLHGGGFIVMTVTMSKYVNAVVPDELKTGGQMLLSVVGFGIARVFGIVFGGLVSEISGSIRNGFIFSAILCLIALALFAPVFLRGKPLNGQ